ncbi:MAG: hypothetical protein AAFO69_13055, partial [Bacteroidota bacterium]
MIRNLKIALLLLLAVACQEQSKPTAEAVILSGKITNYAGNSFSIINRHSVTQAVVTVDSTGIFSDTLQLEEGFYRISAKNESHKIYLRPGFQLQMNLDYAQYDETLSYQGEGAAPNNYLAQQYLLQEGFGNLTYYGYYAKLPEDEFLSLTDSLHQLELNLFSNAPIDDERFMIVEENNLKYALAVKIADYQGMRRFVTGDKSFNVSEDYPDGFEGFDPNQADLLIAPGYNSAVSKFVQKK